MNDMSGPVGRSLSSRLRVAFLIASLHTGGAQRQLASLALGLHRRGHDVAVYTLRPGGIFARSLERAGVPLFSAFQRRSWRVAGFSRLVCEIRRRPVDVLHSYLPTANVLSVLLRPLMRGVTVVWGVRMTRTDERRYGPFHRFVFGLERSSLWRGDLIVVNARAVCDEVLAQGFPEERIELIPNGLDGEFFRFSPEGRERWRGRWGLRDEDRAIGLVGRFDVMKGHETFIEAARCIAARDPRARFVCVGSGSRARTRELRSLAADLGDRITWQTSTGRVAEVYSALDLLCSASHFGEGFPNVVAEAILCGTPCVVTDVGDGSALVKPADRIVPPGDAGALARACMERIGARRLEHSMEARRRILDAYPMSRMIDRTEEALIEAVRRRRHRSCLAEVDASRRAE